MKKIIISLLSILVLLTPTYVFAEDEEMTLPSASPEPSQAPVATPTPTPEATPEPTPTPTPTPEVKKDPTYRLKSVKMTGAEFVKPTEFKPTEYDYKIKITDQSKFKIEAVALDEGGNVSYNIDTDNINIDFIKRNGIKIWVTVDGKTNDQRIYEFKLEEEVLSSKLSKLELEGGNYPFNEKFDKDTLRYTVSIPNEVDTITINAVAEEKDAQITISPEKTTDLKVGINNFKITVKNSGSTTTYTLVVTREEKEEVEEKQTSIISTTSSDLTTTGTDKDFKEPDNPDSTFNMIMVTLGCLFLIAIGGIGIYFFFKTSPKRMKKELIKERTSKKEETSPMFEVKEEPKTNENKQPITSDADNIIENLEDTKEFKN